MQQEILADKKILTVSELNRSVKRLLETHFQILWIEGEISNLSRPQSGHLYFTLKDEHAQVRCAMFRARNFTVPFEFDNGMYILAAARISLYEGRGDYQLIIEHVEERGEGLLRRRFEILKNKLAAEGLFDLSHKQQLPLFPKCIGVITSPTGAAIRDVLSVLKRRFANIPIIIYPTAVQGETAARQIADTISVANLRNECDALIICRGGGTLEDLFAFNEEIVARAIFNSKIPTVSGIGHEVDYTISDFVVDQRAPTPSAAAELLSPDKKEYCEQLLRFTSRFAQLTRSELRHRKMQITNFNSKLVHPERLLQQYTQTIDLLEQGLSKSLFRRVELEKNKLQILSIKLNHFNPTLIMRENQTQLSNKMRTLVYLISEKINQSKQNLQSVTRTLHTVSPLNTLERGYSIVTKETHVIDDIANIKDGDAIKVEVKTGYIFCTVDECKAK